jgi:uncharacterized DUF497 family protein
MPPGFEWDPEKAAENLLKHGVSFEEASTAFVDRLSLTIEDLEHSGSEERYILLGYSTRDRLLMVSHTFRGENIRIISAKRAGSRFKRQYDNR